MGTAYITYMINKYQPQAVAGKNLIFKSKTEDHKIE